MTRAPGPLIKGSGRGKNPGASKSLLNFAAISRDSSRCCFDLRQPVHVCFEGQNISGLQNRVIVKTHRHFFAVFTGFVLELGHAVEPANPGHAIEIPGQFRMGLHA